MASHENQMLTAPVASCQPVKAEHTGIASIRAEALGLNSSSPSGSEQVTGDVGSTPDASWCQAEAMQIDVHKLAALSTVPLSQGLSVPPLSAAAELPGQPALLTAQYTQHLLQLQQCTSSPASDSGVPMPAATFSSVDASSLPRSTAAVAAAPNPQQLPPQQQPSAAAAVQAPAPAAGAPPPSSLPCLPAVTPLLEANYALLNQYRANMVDFRVAENLDILVHVRDNLLRMLSAMEQHPGVISQMPPLPVQPNLQLADKFLPKQPILAPLPPQLLPAAPPPGLMGAAPTSSTYMPLMQVPPMAGTSTGAAPGSAAEAAAAGARALLIQQPGTAPATGPLAPPGARPILGHLPLVPGLTPLAYQQLLAAHAAAMRPAAAGAAGPPASLAPGATGPPPASGPAGPRGPLGRGGIPPALSAPGAAASAAGGAPLAALPPGLLPGLLPGWLPGFALAPRLPGGVLLPPRMVVPAAAGRGVGPPAGLVPFLPPGAAAPAAGTLPVLPGTGAAAPPVSIQGQLPAAAAGGHPQAADAAAAAAAQHAAPSGV